MGQCAPERLCAAAFTRKQQRRQLSDSDPPHFAHAKASATKMYVEAPKDPTGTKTNRMICKGHRVRMLLASLGVMGIAATSAIGLSGEDAVAASPELAIAYLNQQRAAFGIPPVTLDQSLLKPECSLANHEIASPSTTWSGTVSPWGEAPFHEATLYDPSNVSGAYGEYNGFASNNPTFPSSSGTWACMWFRRDNGGTPGFYWAAEASGPNAVPPLVNASEWPNTPAEAVGLSNPTGPNIILYAKNIKGYPAAVSAAVVSQAGMSVPVHLAFDRPEGAVLVVDHPVESKTRFEASVRWRAWEFAGPEKGEIPVDYTQQFSFTTGSAPSALRTVTPLLRLANGGRIGKRVRVWVRSDESLRGREVEASVAILRRRCGKQRTPPRPGCGWGTSHRRVRHVALANPKLRSTWPSRRRAGGFIFASPRSHST